MSAHDEARAVLLEAGIDVAELDALVRAAARREASLVELARERARGAPLAYVVGETVFLGVTLLAEPGALAPRAETELLGRTALARLATVEGDPRVVDMCTGSGNLACAIAVHAPRARVWAADLTDGCVGLARKNAHHVGHPDRIHVHQGDLFGALVGLELEQTIDVIVCNPPYISAGRLAKDRASLLSHEPREAFDGGPYGLSIHQRVIRDAVAFLRPGGHLTFEIGQGQEKQLAALFARSGAYEDVGFEVDEEQRPRVIHARRKRHADAPEG